VKQNKIKITFMSNYKILLKFWHISTFCPFITISSSSISTYFSFLFVGKDLTLKESSSVESHYLCVNTHSWY
jgi:hypothetical protein